MLATRTQSDWNIFQELFLEKLPQNGDSKYGDNISRDRKSPALLNVLPGHTSGLYNYSFLIKKFCKKLHKSDLGHLFLL